MTAPFDRRARRLALNREHKPPPTTPAEDVARAVYPDPKVRAQRADSPLLAEKLALAGVRARLPLRQDPAPPGGPAGYGLPGRSPKGLAIPSTSDGDPIADTPPAPVEHVTVTPKTATGTGKVKR